MNFSRSQLIITGSVIFIVLLVVGIVTGIIPGVRKNTEKLPEINLTVWGIDNEDLFRENFIGYQVLRPNVQTRYKQLNPDTYERDFINALASGTGPDIIMFHNSWLPKHLTKIIPVGEDQLSLNSLKQLFPTVIEQDFAPDNKIYALPLYMDTLALFYNQDIFDRNGIAISPKDWLDFQNLIPKLRQKNADGKIAKAAAAIGGSSNSIYKAPDLLMLLMLQAGTKMTDDEFTQATFTQNIGGLFPGLDALNFYTKFSDPTELYYTWDDTFEYSPDSFAKGDTAIIFAYASEKENLRSKNPFLSFKTAEIPQLSGSDKAVTFPDYWGLAVTNNSENPEWAWDLILYLTANETAAENYIRISDRPPALRNVIQKYTDHPELGVFAKQALFARSWPRIDEKIIDQAFSDMIRSILEKQLKAKDALEQAEKQVTELMRARR